MLLRTSIFILTIVTLTSVSRNDKDLKTIIKDGQFSKLPREAKNIKAEIVKGEILRFGYLSFEGPTDILKDWLQESKLTEASIVEIFDKNVIVDERKRPKWFIDYLEKHDRTEIYYYRQTDKFTTIVYPYSNILLIEYQRTKDK